MDDTGSGQTTWLDILNTGVSGLIDSQIAKNYAINDPRYNTQYGVAGQAQYQPLNASSPLLWVGLAVAVVAVVLLVRR